MIALHCGGSSSKKKVLLTQQDIKARLEFTSQYLKLRDEVCKFVLWSDESKFKVFGHMDAALFREGTVCTVD